MPLRDRKLLDLAHRVQACQVQIPSVCIGHSEHGCEPAHGPKSWLDGGMGCKSHDVHACACHNCHFELDQGKALTREERAFYWGRGAARTWALYVSLGWLKVAA